MKNKQAENNQVEIFCQICAGSFDSQDSSCQKCEHHEDGYKMFGRTTSNKEYQLAMLLVEQERMEKSK